MFKLEYHGHFKDDLVIVQYEPTMFPPFRRVKNKFHLLAGEHTGMFLTGLNKLTLSELGDLLSYLKSLEITNDIALCIKLVQDQIDRIGKLRADEIYRKFFKDKR